MEQIQLTEKLLKDGFAYESNGSVYFDVLEYNRRGLNYGELSRRNIEELFANTRDLDGQGEKAQSSGFCLVEEGFSCSYHALGFSLGGWLPRLALGVYCDEY